VDEGPPPPKCPYATHNTPHTSACLQLHDKAKDGLQSKTGSEEVAVQRATQVG